MDIIISVLTNQSFLGAIIASIAFIFIGFLLRRINLIKEGGRKVLNTIVMNVAIPCMAFCAFMNDFDVDKLSSNLIIFAIDIVFYIFFLAIGRLIFIKFGKEKGRIYAILISIGQLTFFSMPLLAATYGSESGILITTSLMSIAFRLFTYLYSYVIITGEKITKDNVGKTLRKVFVNPIMICMFLGLLIWLIQNVIWQVEIDGICYGFLRIDKTLPALYKIFQFGNNMATPLCMLTIGLTLGESNILEAIKNGLAWVIATIRVLIIPLVILGICILIQLTGLIHFDEIQLAAMVIGNAAPVGAIVAVYCVDSNKEAYIASDSIMLSTVLSFISIPILFILVKLTLTLPIF